MLKVSNREKILNEGLRVVHERGFAGASVRDIVQAAGVPQGSFSNHFASKEAFGLEILERYLARVHASIAATLLNESFAPIERLRAYLNDVEESLQRNDMRNGCLFGNFSAESSDNTESIRCRLKEIFTEVQTALATCLRAAVAAGQAPADLDCEEMAGFVFSSLQGAILVSKAERSPLPFQRFKNVILTRILRPA